MSRHLCLLVKFNKHIECQRTYRVPLILSIRSGDPFNISHSLILNIIY